MNTAEAIPAAGTVDGVDVPVAVVDEALERLYASPVAGKLPPHGDMEWRRLRRWVAQLVLTEELVRAEARRLGVGASDSDRPRWTDVMSGTLATAVLARDPLARALRDRVTAELVVPERDVVDYYSRNADRWRSPARARLRHLLRPDRAAAIAAIHRLAGEGERWDRPIGELPAPLAAAVRAARIGDVVGPVESPFGWHLALVDDVVAESTASYDEVRARIAAELRTAAQAAYFQRWLEGRRRELVTSAHGFEHPGDPRQPDFAHHH